METTTLIIIVSTLLVLTAVLCILMQHRVWRISPRKRFTVFAAVLGFGVTTQIVGAVIALVGRQALVASLFMVNAALLSGACVLEMRKLTGELGRGR